jgi:uncharacterized protein YfaP (DUF2135 family)
VHSAACRRRSAWSSQPAGENTVREKRETFVVALRKIGELTLVKSFVF